MARNSDWKNDEKLQRELTSYVAQNLKRVEILDYMKRDFGEYEWSLSTLARRLRAFEISYINYDTDLDTVKNAFQTEVNGPGKLLGYRAMNLKLRTEHGIQVPRHLVYNVMKDIDPEGLEERNVKRKGRKKKRPFTSEGPLWLVSLDGHDKLCGYQNWTFPLGVYGCLDTFSRKILFLFVCFSNSDPNVIGKRYMKYLVETDMLPRYLRLDKGIETGKMCTIHAYLVDKLGLFADPIDSVVYGPSTSNKIERWWRDLHHRLEQYFKSQLTTLLNSREYDPRNDQHRQILAYVYIPIVQRECDSFVTQWNTHRIRAQNKLELPTGIPEHMFSFPENYGGTSEGTEIPAEYLAEVANLSGIVMDADIDNLDFMEDGIKRDCEHYLPDPIEIPSKDALEAYRFLKHKLLST